MRFPGFFVVKASDVLRRDENDAKIIHVGARRAGDDEI